MIRRYPAVPLKIKYILEGRYVPNEGFTSFLVTNFGMPVSRTHVLGTVTNVYETDDKKYAFIVIDDGTGNIRSKSFQDITIFENIKVGDIVDLIGRIREYNDERYIAPELLTKLNDTNMISYRNVEIAKILKEWKNRMKFIKEKLKENFDLNEAIEKYKMSEEEIKLIVSFLENGNEEEKEEVEEVDIKVIKNEILKKLEELDDGEGVDYSKILESMDLPESTIENALNELLSEGSCYEPRAGKIKAL